MPQGGPRKLLSGLRSGLRGARISALFELRDALLRAEIWAQTVVFRVPGDPSGRHLLEIWRKLTRRKNKCYRNEYLFRRGICSGIFEGSKKDGFQDVTRR